MARAVFVAERAKAAPAASTSYAISVSGITVGNVLFLFLAIAPAGSTPGISTISDDVGNSWTIDTSVIAGAASCGYAVCSCQVQVAPATITVTTNFAGNGVCYKVEEFSWATARSDASSSNKSGTTAAV